jgi:hypothetical protein
MLLAFKRHIVVDSDRHIVIRDSGLAPGTRVEVIVLVEQPGGATPAGPPLPESAGGTTPDERDTEDA